MSIDFLSKPYNRLRSVVPASSKPTTLSFIVICIATSLDNINIGATMTSLPSITAKFNVESTVATWTISAYALTLSSFIILAGTLSDMFGHERVFIISSFISAIFALLCAVIPDSIIAVIVMRAFQGCFAAALIPCSFGLTGNLYRGAELQKAIGYLMFSLTAALGFSLVIGGAFGVSSIGYKGVYYVSFAISVLCAIILVFICPEIPRTEQHNSLKLKNLDFAGCCGLIVSLVLIVLGLTEGGEKWSRPRAYVPLIVGFLLLISVLFYEMIYIQGFKNKYKDSEEHKEDWKVRLQLLFPREILNIQNFLHYTAGSFLGYIIFTSIFTILVEYYQYITQDSPVMIGVKSLPFALGVGAMAVIYNEKLALKIGKKRLIVFSPLFQLTMAVWASRLDFTVAHSYWKYECFSLFLMGAGISIYFNIFWNELLACAPLHIHGALTGIVQTCSQIGVCLGTAIVATILGELKITDDIDVKKSYDKKFKNAFYMIFAATGLMFIIMLFTKPVNLETEQEAQEAKKIEEGKIFDKESCEERTIDV